MNRNDIPLHFNNIPDLISANAIESVFGDHLNYVAQNPIGSLWSQRMGTVANWVDIAQTSNGNMLYAAGAPAATGLAKSSDGGKTWTLVPVKVGTASPVQVTIVGCSPNGLIVAAFNSTNLYLSQDGGTTWADKGLAISNTNIVGFQILQDGTNTLVFGSGNGKFYKSTNLGTSWTQFGPTSPATGWYDLSVSHNGQVMIATQKSAGNTQLQISRDGGATWAPVTQTGMSLPWMYCKVSGDGTTMMAGTYGTTATCTAWLSEDAGVTWTQLPFTFGSVAAVAGVGVSASVDGKVLMVWRVQQSQAKMMSIDGGATWADQATALQNVGALPYAFEVLNPNTGVVLGPYGKGIWGTFGRAA